MENMELRYAYWCDRKLSEVIVGRETDLDYLTKKGYMIYFCRDNTELYNAVKSYRTQEWIITVVSELPEFSELLHWEYVR
jgi:hypothetical protein